MTDTYDYEGLKALAKELGRPVSTLIAQAPASDPFYAGAPARRAAAEWFAALWQQFDFPRGIHIRGVHYALVSHRVQFLEDKPYENTEECWQKLCYAARDARHLGLVLRLPIGRPFGLPDWHLLDDSRPVLREVVVQSQDEFLIEP